MRFRFVNSVVMIALVALMATGCGMFGPGKPHDLNWKVASFTAQDENSQPFSLTNMKGKVWVANFFFSSCTTVCPLETSNMALIQRKMKEAHVNADLVSFSVDPERDTPDVLKTFAAKYQADIANWHFLTGYRFDDIQKLSEDSFKSALARPAPGDDQFTHGTAFYLVDQNGVIVKKYDGYSDTPYDQIVKDAKALL